MVHDALTRLERTFARRPRCVRTLALLTCNSLAASNGVLGAPLRTPICILRIKPSVPPPTLSITPRRCALVSAKTTALMFHPSPNCGLNCGHTRKSHRMKERGPHKHFWPRAY